MQTESSFEDLTFPIVKVGMEHQIAPVGDRHNSHDILLHSEMAGEILHYAPFIEGVRYIAEHFSRDAERQTAEPGKYSWYLSESSKVLLDLIAISGEQALVATVLEKKYRQQLFERETQPATVSDEQARELIKYFLSMMKIALDKIDEQYKVEYSELKIWVERKIKSLQDHMASLKKLGRQELIVGILGIDEHYGLQRQIAELLERSPDPLKFWGKVTIGYTEYQQEVLGNAYDGSQKVVDPKNFMPFVTSVGVVRGMAGRVEITQMASALEDLFPQLTTSNPEKFLQLVQDHLRNGQDQALQKSVD